MCFIGGEPHHNILISNGPRLSLGTFTQSTHLHVSAVRILAAIPLLLRQIWNGGGVIRGVARNFDGAVRY